MVQNRLITFIEILPNHQTIDAAIKTFIIKSLCNEKENCIAFLKCVIIKAISFNQPKNNALGLFYLLFKFVLGKYSTFSFAVTNDEKRRQKCGRKWIHIGSFTPIIICINFVFVHVCVIVWVC